jgi:hypothetical protein
MKYSITPRETKYKDILFRSRLEAKWACFFDLVGWMWQYEPSEINGYNPDFIINVKSKSYDTNTIIVEVKPSVYLDDNEKKSIIRKYNNVKAHILILSDIPFLTNSNGDIVIGCGSQYFNEQNHIDYYDIEMKCVDDFGSVSMSFDGMIYGIVERKYFMDKNNSDYGLLINYWNEAGNITKFKI